jgi:hypothetical protein
LVGLSCPVKKSHVRVNEIVALREERLSQNHRGSVRKAIAVIQAGAVASFSKAAESRSGKLPLFDDFQKLATIRLPPQDRQEYGSIDYERGLTSIASAGKTGMIVPEDLICRPVIQHRQTGAVLGDLFQFIRQTSPAAFAPHSHQTIPQRLHQSLGLGFTSLSGQLRRELFGLRVANIHRHDEPV